MALAKVLVQTIWLDFLNLNSQDLVNKTAQLVNSCLLSSMTEP